MFSSLRERSGYRTPWQRAKSATLLYCETINNRRKKDFNT